MNYIDCFVMYDGCDKILPQLKEEKAVSGITLIVRNDFEGSIPEEFDTVRVDGFLSSQTLNAITQRATTQFVLVVWPKPVSPGYGAINRMISVAMSLDAACVYSDYYCRKNEELVQMPLIDCFYGSIRDDFDFGSMVIYSLDSLNRCREQHPESQWKYSAFYELHLAQLRNKRRASIFHLREYLYTVDESDLRKSGEKQFDYVNPRNRDVQIEREQVALEHLRRIEAYIPTYTIQEIDATKGSFEQEASVIIPVRNRVRTIADAVNSALSQVTTFPYNVIVVDNHSTDGTTESLNAIAQKDDRLIVIKPERTDLGIGGCWSVAVNDERCGRFAVQLDSDDLYSGTDTLQRIVDKFYEERCAMVIGSYRMCNFNLETLPPGIIDHKEWTDDDGRNNALRINGLGAPRAFFVPQLRKIGVPNTSYGEDYALGLAFSRKYRIGRIYDELYLCRRWEGNSDAALSPEQVNRNNMYKDNLRTIEIVDRQNLNALRNAKPSVDEINDFFHRQLSVWKDAAEHYSQLSNAVNCGFESESYKLAAQWNPMRIVSTGAKIDSETISRRPCFLCEINRPDAQKELPMMGKYELLVNPYPILPQHFTIAKMHHQPQRILENYKDMINMALAMSDKVVFYNGPRCGASCPDHMHFQAGSKGCVPLERDWDELYRFNRSRIYPVTGDEFVEASSMEGYVEDAGIYTLRGYVCPAFIIISSNATANHAMFRKVYDILPVQKGEEEPMMNILAWSYMSSYDGTKRVVSVVIPRSKHRPDCYYKEGDEQCLVSPGALDMGGLLITPMEKDFHAMTLERARDIIAECGISPDDETEYIFAMKKIR